MPIYRMNPSIQTSNYSFKYLLQEDDIIRILREEYSINEVAIDFKKIIGKIVDVIVNVLKMLLKGVLSFFSIFKKIYNRFKNNEKKETYIKPDEKIVNIIDNTSEWKTLSAEFEKEGYIKDKSRFIKIMGTNNIIPVTNGLRIGLKYMASAIEKCSNTILHDKSLKTIQEYDEILFNGSINLNESLMDFLSSFSITPVDVGIYSIIPFYRNFEDRVKIHFDKEYVDSLLANIKSYTKPTSIKYFFDKVEDINNSISSIVCYTFIKDEQEYKNAIKQMYDSVNDIKKNNSFKEEQDQKTIAEILVMLRKNINAVEQYVSTLLYAYKEMIKIGTDAKNQYDRAKSLYKKIIKKYKI